MDTVKPPGSICMPAFFSRNWISAFEGYLPSKWESERTDGFPANEKYLIKRNRKVCSRPDFLPFSPSFFSNKKVFYLFFFCLAFTIPPWKNLVGSRSVIEFRYTCRLWKRRTSLVNCLPMPRMYACSQSTSTCMQQQQKIKLYIDYNHQREQESAIEDSSWLVKTTHINNTRPALSQC